MPLPLPSFETLPKLSEPHLVADYIELLCLIHPDREVSRSDILDRIRERADVEAEPEPEELRRGLEEADTDEGSPAAAIDDAWERQASDWFALLSWRASAFTTWYPFAISPDGVILSAPEELSDQQQMYVFLLAASALRHFNKRDQTLIASAFEVLGLEALTAYLPRGSEVHMFGKHPGNRGRYSGKLFYRLERLGKDLGAQLNCEESDFDQKDTGDKGLDIVGWIPLGDQAWGVLGVFVQCACTMDWIKKQNETSKAEWEQYLHVIPHPQQLTFIPFSYRTQQGEWYKPRKRTTVLVDRSRLLHLLRHRYTKLLPAVTPYTAKVLGIEESVFGN